MHEVGIIESTLDVVRREAARHGAGAVTRVVLRVGAISGAEPDALRFAFEAARPESVVADAELEIELVPARAHCAACAADFTVEHGFLYACPHCAALSGDLRAGRELELARIEFTMATPPHA